MKLLNDALIEELRQVFSSMKDSVNVILFTTKVDCETCEQTLSFMEELDKTGDKINFIHYDVDASRDQVERYTIERTPAIVIVNPKEGYQGVKFNGIPAGHEVNSFISAILEVSGIGEILANSILERIHNIKEAVHIKVFVTLG